MDDRGLDESVVSRTDRAQGSDVHDAVPTDLRHTFVETNGIRLHVALAGPDDGPLVLLLHGFPEFWYGWRQQLSALSDAGYCVWAPDQRGYNLSDKPDGIAAYGIDQLAKDAIGLIDAAGRDQAVLVGHDWGAAVAWWTAEHYPDRVRQLVAINVPHGRVMAHHLRHNARQLLRSWYILFFQLPRLPETVVRLGDWSMATRALRGTSMPGTFTPADIDAYRAAWSQPGALRAMINWYRAALQVKAERETDGRITVPTLLIWGAQDRFLGQEMAQPSIELCSNGRLALVKTATHWVHHEEPKTVNTLLLSFLVGGRRDTTAAASL